MEFKTVLENMLTFSIGTISVSTCIIFIAKAVFNKWMDIEMEKYKLKLNSQLEEFKIEKQRLEDENKFKFTKLHEDRAVVIKNLYSMITEIELSIDDYMKYIKLIINRKNSWYMGIYEFQEELYNKLNKYSRYYKNNKILFDDEIMIMLDEIEQLVSIVIDLFELDEEICENQDREDASKYIDTIHHVARILNNEKMKLTKGKLENEFKNILGVYSK
ncbi:MAG: hypothetical protein RR942_03860 [Romboutsia sp.]